MSDKPRLQPDFIPVWKSEFNDLKTMPRTAFILRMIYRAYRDPQTSICALSDCEIERLTGWSRRPIKNARRYLLAHSHIKSAGYHTYILNDFKRFKLSTSSAQSAQPQENSSAQSAQPVEHKSLNSSAQSAQQMSTKYPVHNNKRDKELLESNNNPFPIELKDDLKLLFTHQGQQGDPLLVFFYTVAQERLNKGYKPGLLRIAIKRAISANSKANIQDILSYENLHAIKAEQEKIKKQAEDDKKLKDWQNEPRFEGSKKEDKA